MVRKQTSLDLGYELADVLVKNWNLQTNPPKVYIEGNRIHHGFVGFTSTAIGFVGLVLSALSDDKKTQTAIVNVSGLLMGAGVRLMEDDMADVNNWFNFENHTANSQQFQNKTGYSLFG